MGPEMAREIAVQLSQPLFRGIPVGQTLTDVLTINFVNGRGDWGFASRWKDRARKLKYFLRPVVGRSQLPSVPQGRIVVTWIHDNFRISDLVLPVLKEIGPDRCVVLGGKPDVLPRVPAGALAVLWNDALRFDAAAWRADYRKCRRRWQTSLAGLCHKYDLPRGACDLLTLHMLFGSQHVAGCLELLRTLQPSAIVTEYDRNALWASLVLSARALKIPTFTLVHGVLGEHADGYVPVLADAVLCWGEMQRRQLIQAGEPPEKVLVAGCPRLTRELAVAPVQARGQLGLPADRPAVMLGTSPVSTADCLNLAEAYCAGMEKLDGVSALVRLHPSEKIETYEPVAKRYPGVRFLKNSDATLDEALAAADIVVVSISGLGSDALVKRRLTVILDVPPSPHGHGIELVERAGCPLATSSESLREIIPRLLADGPERRACERAREEFIGGFCACFGDDSARRIATIVRQSVGSATFVDGNGAPK